MGIEIRTNVPERKPVAAAKSAREGSVMEAMEKGDFRPSKAITASEIEASKQKMEWSKPVQNEIDSIHREFAKSVDAIVQKHQERLAYNAAYQRDLRTIKRLGLSVTVAEWRKTNG